jgi:heme a synthase
LATPTAIPPLARPPTYRTNYSRFAFGVLAWNVLVVLWGAYVRASGSGAGCGSHWPLCNGEIVPVAPRIETIIEFTHRMMSGIALAGVVALWLWTRSRFPQTNPVRRVAWWSVVFIITEALLGAGLVLFNYVDKDQSVGRAIYLSLHLLNTLLLLGALALTAWFSSDGFYFGGRRWPRLVIWALPIAALVSVAGAIAALGDTLFPSATLAQGFHQDFRRRIRVAIETVPRGPKHCDRSSDPNCRASDRRRTQPATTGARLDANHAFVSCGCGLDRIGAALGGSKTAVIRPSR